MSYIIDRLFDIINDTSDKDFREISMSSFSVKINNGLVYYQDHRDIPQIITHTRTSQCVIINSLIPSYKTSTKSRIIRNDDYRTYSDKARRNYQELINSKSQDDLNQFMEQIYELFLESKTNNDYITCDDLLSCIDTECCDPVVLLSLVIASFPIRNKLSKRTLFYNDVMCRFTLLYGLEEALKMLNRLR